MGKKVLIADDEPNIVVSLEFLMKQRGYDVKVVNDGDDALKAVDEFRPDLILLDVMMPRVSGYDVCQKVRENPAGTVSRIIMLSAKGRDVEVTQGHGDRRRCLRHEAVLDPRPDRQGRARCSANRPGPRDVRPDRIVR